MKPEELKAYLDEYMVRQDEAKQVLATKICTHFNRIKRFELNRKKKRPDTIGEIKNNIIMIGPTGRRKDIPCQTDRQQDRGSLCQGRRDEVQ